MKKDSFHFSGEVKEVFERDDNYYAKVSSGNNLIDLPIPKEVYDNYLEDYKRCVDDSSEDVIHVSGKLEISLGVRIPF